jgi:hypothetical protein
MRAGNLLRVLAASGATALVLAVTVATASSALALPPAFCNGLAVTLQTDPITRTVTAAMSPVPTSSAAQRMSTPSTAASVTTPSAAGTA